MTNSLACGTTEFYVFRPRGAIDQDFLFHFIRQVSYRRAARATMQSGVGQARVPKEFVLKTELLVPPLAEQKRIVAKIEALQERSRRAREALSEVGPLLEQFRQSVLAAAFRGDLTADWRAAHPNADPASELLHRISTELRRCLEEAELAKYEAKRQKPPENWQERAKEQERVDNLELPELPSGWKWVTVEEIAATHRHSLSSGPFGSSLGKKDYVQIGVPVIRGQNIQAGVISGDFVYVTESKANELARSTARPGDVVLIAVGSSGRPAIVP
jgi:type I restriction enzyme, S subunit